MAAAPLLTLQTNSSAAAPITSPQTIAQQQQQHPLRAYKPLLSSSSTQYKHTNHCSAAAAPITRIQTIT
jgi:hypothetical protein